jgi:hypothetical protein
MKSITENPKEGTTFDEPAKMSGVKGIKIKKCHFTINNQDMLTIVDCDDCEIIDCTFEHKPLTEKDREEREKERKKKKDRKRVDFQYIHVENHFKDNKKDDKVKGITINHCMFKDHKLEDDMLQLVNCKNCEIKDCTFDGKKTKGNFIHIRGDKCKSNVIENCTFKHQNYPGEMVEGEFKQNGGEAIIIGLDDWSGCRYETYVRKCEFIDCTGDPEPISIKSCDNVIENNCIRASCDGNITVRHGGINIIQNNVFEGSAGGIRIFGFGNMILGNYHKDNDNDDEKEKTRKRRPLIIENGVEERDPNFDKNDIPKDKEGSGATYAQSRKNIIKDNTYDNCKGACVIWGLKTKGGNTLIPKDNEFRNNKLIAENKDSSFLKIIVDEKKELKPHDYQKDNTFEDNKMYGKKDKAKPGDLPAGSAKYKEGSPPNTIPDTKCNA